jgi:O-antigen/teichoic acid export membrane protein
VVIGKFFPIKSVGYYQNANNLVQVSTGILTSVFSSVTFTIFASIQDNNKRLKEGYKIILRQLFFWLCPIFVLAGVLAVPMFRFVFTEKWLPAVPYFRWLCIVGILFPLNSYNLNIVNIKGRSDIDLKLTIIEKTMITIGLFLAIPFGIWAILALQAFNAVFFYVLNSYYTGRFIDYGMIEQIKDILPTLLLSIAMGVIVFFVEQSLVEFSDLIRLVIGFAVGASFYWLSAKCCNLSPYLDFVSIVKHRLLSKFA